MIGHRSEVAPGKIIKARCQPEQGLRMPTFTLVLIAILVTGGGGGPTITNQPGYLTLEECQAAAREFKEAAQLSSASLEAYCIRGPRR